MYMLPKRALVVACVTTLLGADTSALATESAPASAPSTGIPIQLDDRNLSFPDVAPEAGDGHILLPVHTVFGTMGAEVGCPPVAQTITVTRDGTTVTTTLGGTIATMEYSGVITHIPMDTVLYVHDNRTYAPVRFVTQVFGCTVGWDVGDHTVIPIDMGKLVEGTPSKYDFTYLERYLAYGRKYRTGIQDMDTDFDVSLDMTSLLLGSTAKSMSIILDGTLEGAIVGGAKMDAAMGLIMDLHPFLKALTDSQNGGVSASDTELLDALAEGGIHMEPRGGLEAGQPYTSLGGVFLEQTAGPSVGTWYSMDISTTYGDMGSDYGVPMKVTTGDMDYTTLLSLLLSTVGPSDKDTVYSELTQAIDLATQLLWDDAWTVSGNDRILHYVLEQDGVAADLIFTLTMRGDDVSAYDLSVGLSADVNGSAPMSISLQEPMDADGGTEVFMQCDAVDLMDLRLSMSGRYTEGKTVPETEPPKGTVVMDLTTSEAPADPAPISGDPAEVVIDGIYTTNGGFIGVTES